MVLLRAFLTLTLTVTEVLLVGTVTLCGKELADMLDMVCYGRGFYWVPTHERQTLSKRTALSYLIRPEVKRQHPLRRGVVEECCYRPCEMDTLDSYCAAPAGTYNPHATNAPMPRRVYEQLMNYTTGISFTGTSIAPSRRTRLTTANRRPGSFFFVGSTQRHRTVPMESL